MAQTQRVDVAGALANDQATVTNSAIDIGPIGSIFDGNTDTLARTANVNPMVVTLTSAPVGHSPGLGFIFSAATVSGGLRRLIRWRSWTR